MPTDVLADRPRLVRLPGVFDPPSDTWVLAGAGLAEVAARDSPAVLDLCTGTGAVGIVLARAGARVTAIDVGRRAAWNARANALLNRASVEVLRGDLFAPVAGRHFDLIVTNPPYVPSANDLPSSGPARAWEAGHDGRAFIDRICAEAYGHLRPGGALLVVHSSVNGIEATAAAMRGLEVDVARRERGPLGPLMRAAGVPGDAEDVVVVRGRRKAGENSGSSG
jgi:release factor glutamine methyltransferase